MGYSNGNLAEKETKVSAVKNKSSSGKKASGNKSNRSGKASEDKKAVPVRKASKKKKTPAGRKISKGKRAASGREVSDRRKESSGRKASGTRAAVDKTAENNRDDLESRMSRRDEERARRRAERERKVRRQKIVMAVSLCIIVLSVICVVLFCMSSAKLSFRLFQGDRYLAKEDYMKAQSAYEKALAVDDASVKAYRGLADIYSKQQMASEAEQILYTGWERTQDESLLRYYSVAVLNQAVAEINAKNCTLDTVEKCVRVLEQGSEEQKALELLTACYERLFRVTEEDDTCTMFLDEDMAQDTCSYTEYEQLVGRLLKVYQTSPSEERKQVLKRYALIDMPYMRISISHMESYLAMLTEINSTLNDADLADTIACLARAKEIEDYFGTAFDEFRAGNYAYARELVSEEEYQKIRDGFIEESSGYWEGSVYIPVSREQIILHREEGSVRFSFPDSEDHDDHQGIITVWGTHQEDDGIQRSVISYEPPMEPGADSKTEYTIQYLYSNVKIDGQYVPQMNYRFDTKVTTSEGITTNAIGDWGGEHEWEIDY